MSDAPKLLDGLRILSFCHYLQGPAATQYLADMGAEVVKVEPTGGAFERHWAGGDTYVDGVSAFFLSANRNKRSLAVDLKSPDGLAILRRLIATYDVVVENYRPGVMERLGLGYEDVRAINPAIIYASATGFGIDGPMRDRPGQDLLIQARVGLIAACGDVRASPTPVGCAAVDQHGAALLALGIVGAYVRRLKTGAGTRVEASLLNAGIDLQAEALTLYYSGKNRADVLVRDPHLATWFHQAPYGVYRIADGFVAFSLGSLTTLARALDDEAVSALAASHPLAERDRIARAVAAAVAGRRYDDLSAALDAQGVWYQRVQTYDELRDDPQVVHNEMFRDIPVGRGTATLVNHPLRYDGKAPSLGHLALAPGQHTAEILAEAGLSRAEIDSLSHRKVILAQDDPFTHDQQKGRAA